MTIAGIKDRLQTFTNAEILAIAAGQVDIAAIARREIANRGLGREGTWVGFDKAAEVWREGNDVAAGCECPQCGEANADALAFLDDDETVRCERCGNTYQP